MTLLPEVWDARKFSGRFFRPPGRLLRVTGLAFFTLQAENGVETPPGIWRRARKRARKSPGKRIE
jgi:hypothetical protein